ncbi:cell wall metabolism sensor histidine kinase WalK [Sporosarcina sp. P21c]|uniref:cell wall metabolism sensor histidine kinase WalK n=1 Tax=Sporosarcina TaxID=1569 RepID=UPI000A14A4C1|nr:MULTISPECIES: cell wall metabolism sensor histidine kinase WalK [Sporosarcina]ARJ39036.1 PAS domain-containing sensor histidine kinase [Sporosarcina ureae]PIC66406.1 cell wall metabolism sensor histidine kinase WalK [Sporosarcina sp. P16a]PIC90343.1 cell wall metabolism sensor histidine kinase WalK [Sporosarcina sp. P21c]PIC93871.1 cell wall metabolism sensor histidine kinase WalK [Sporosarcina sp. P25]
MHKVGFFRSIQVKFVLIYVLLILVSMQIIGLYFARELEQTLKDNFTNSIVDRMNLVEFSVREEITKKRKDNDPTLEQSLKNVLVEFTSDDIIEVQVINPKYRILATSSFDNQMRVGQHSTNDNVRKSITSETMKDVVMMDPQSHNRVLSLAKPIFNGNEVVGSLYVEANIESVFQQIEEINRILAGAAAVSLTITILVGIFIARAFTRPISDMRRQARAMAKGNFTRKVKVYGSDEMGQLAIAFNHLTNQLQESQSTTESERRKLASVLENMTDGVISTDRKGRVSLINDSALQMLGVTNDLVINRPIANILGIDDAYTFEELIQMKESIPLDFSTEDQAYILRATISVTQRETGFVNGLIVVLHDNTEQEKIDMERREFVSNVSHELRTPLTTMRSYLDALAEGAWRNEEIAPNFLHVTQNETERMIRLVNDLLKLSRMDSKEYELNKEWVEFNRFFNAVIERFEFSKSQNVRFTRNLYSSSLFVEIDTDKLTQVLDNIISNALKYSPDGGEVRFGVTVSGDYIKVMISDDGMGIPKSNVNRIFDRFYRADRARSRALGGTGLGLAIAKEMIVAHKGDIWAQSEEGKGTTIFFKLPFEQQEDGEWD